MRAVFLPEEIREGVPLDGESSRVAGLSQCPPIFFSVLRKRKRAVHGPKEKAALVATLHVRAKLLYGGRRIGACSDFAWPSGTLGSSAIPLTAVPWRMMRRSSGCKNAFDQLLFPRVPLYPQGVRRIRKRQSRQRLRSCYALPLRS